MRTNKFLNVLAAAGVAMSGSSAFAADKKPLPPLPPVACQAPTTADQLRERTRLTHPVEDSDYGVIRDTYTTVSDVVGTVEEVANGDCIQYSGSSLTVNTRQAGSPGLVGLFANAAATVIGDSVIGVGIKNAQGAVTQITNTKNVDKSKTITNNTKNVDNSKTIDVTNNKTINNKTVNNTDITNNKWVDNSKTYNTKITSNYNTPKQPKGPVCYNANNQVCTCK